MSIDERVNRLENLLADIIALTALSLRAKARDKAVIEERLADSFTELRPSLSTNESEDHHANPATVS